MKFNLGVFKKALAVSLLVSFAVGVFLGGNLFKNFKYIKPPQTLNVLFYNNFIPAETIRDIEVENNLKINVDFADNIFELEDKLKDPKTKYDLVSIYSYQASDLDEEARLQPINWSMIKNQNNISSDFMNLGGDEIAKKLFPLVWGVNGFAYDPKFFQTAIIDSWQRVFEKIGKSKILLYDIPVSIYQLGILNLQLKSDDPNFQKEVNLKNLLTTVLKFANLYHVGAKDFSDFKNYPVVETSLARQEPLLKDYKFQIPKEGGLFWTLNLAEPRFAPHPKEIAVFLNAVLEKKVASAIVASNQGSTTNKLLDASSIDPKLKSNYIREIPLTSLKFQTSFTDSAVFSQLIDEAGRK